MALKGGSTTSCAACKYRRRKCTTACPLAPYFPANKPKMFRNVHRLFGVSNVTKTLESLETRDQKDDAMKSIIYEAEMRDRFPVYGCSFIINRLALKLQVAREELTKANLQIATCKDQSNQQLDPNSCYWPSPQHMCPTFDCPSFDSLNEDGVPEMFIQSYGGLHNSTTDNDIQSYLEYREEC